MTSFTGTKKEPYFEKNRDFFVYLDIWAALQRHPVLNLLYGQGCESVFTSLILCLGLALSRLFSTLYQSVFTEPVKINQKTRDIMVSFVKVTIGKPRVIFSTNQSIAFHQIGNQFYINILNIAFLYEQHPHNVLPNYPTIISARGEILFNFSSDEDSIKSYFWHCIYMFVITTNSICDMSIIQISNLDRAI